MNKLPEIRYSPAPLWQQERLAQWIQEWEIECRLVEPEGPEEDVRDPAYAIGTAPAVVEEPELHLPAVGQIRLLRPDTVPAALRPVYVAVLERQANGRSVVVPYGRFSEPAIPGELKTGRKEPCLQVLCLWNTQAVADEDLARSWLVGELGADACEEALAVLRFIQQGTALAGELERRLGPPLVHPADPRHLYIDEEDALSIASTADPTVAPRSYLARAAERRARYGAHKGGDAPPNEPSR